MTPEDAEEYTQSLGQIVAGSWRQIAWAHRQGVHSALGLALEEWVRRLGGYVKLSVAERREAVLELSAEGRSNVAVAKVLGVTESTVRADKSAVSDSASRNREQAPQRDAEIRTDPQDASRNREERIATAIVEASPPSTEPPMPPDEGRPASSQSLEGSESRDDHRDEEEEEDEDEPRFDQAGLLIPPAQNLVESFVSRASRTAREAEDCRMIIMRYPGHVTAEIVSAARAAAQAWKTLAQSMEQKYAEAKHVKKTRNKVSPK